MFDKKEKLPGYPSQEPPSKQLPEKELPPSYEDTFVEKTELEDTHNEISAHFMLIQAMDKFLSGFGDYDGVDSEGLIELKQNYQQCILTLGARRFIIFVSALREEFSSGKGLVEFMNTVYPPMDVLITWYALFSRPRSSLHEFKAGGFGQFLEYPFPLIRIAAYIDNKSYQYRPNDAQRTSYIDLIHRYYQRNKIDEPLEYEIPQSFNPYAATLPVYCPSCGDHLTNAKLTAPDHTGFTDAKFRANANACSCGFQPFVDHNNLILRQIYKDAMNPGDSRFLATFDLDLTRLHFDEQSEFGMMQMGVLRGQISNMKYQSVPIEAQVHEVFQNVPPDTKLVIREYVLSNLVHATIPQRSVLQIHRDLVGMYMVSAVFLDTFLDYDEHFGTRHVLNHIMSSREKYEQYLTLYKDTDQLLTPTFDVEFVWRTFRLNQPRYFKSCMKKLNRLVNYDATEEIRLLEACGYTNELFEKKFKQPFCECNCEYCFLVLDKSYRFGKKPDSKLCLSHFPRSDAVSVDRDRSIQMVRRQKHGKWRDTGVEPMYEMYPDIFSVPIHSLFEVLPIGYFYNGTFGPQADPISIFQ